jgi:hypothetical protein
VVTRLRFSQTTAADVSPTMQSYTHGSSTRRKLASSDSSALTTNAFAPDSADHASAGDTLSYQFVSDQMEAGNVISAGGAITAQIQCLEAHSANNLRLQFYVSVVSSDGASERVRLSGKSAGITEMATSLTNRAMDIATENVVDYETQDGDRLLIEVSATGTPGSGSGVQGHNYSVRFGNNGAGGDLPLDESDTSTTKNPWVEFSDTLTFKAAGGATNRGMPFETRSTAFNGGRTLKGPIT